MDKFKASSPKQIFYSFHLTFVKFYTYIYKHVEKEARKKNKSNMSQD